MFNAMHINLIRICYLYLSFNLPELRGQGEYIPCVQFLGVPKVDKVHLHYLYSTQTSKQNKLKERESDIES